MPPKIIVHFWNNKKKNFPKQYKIYFCKLVIDFFTNYINKKHVKWVVKDNHPVYTYWNCVHFIFLKKISFFPFRIDRAKYSRQMHHIMNKKRRKPIIKYRFYAHESKFLSWQEKYPFRRKRSTLPNVFWGNICCLNGFPLLFIQWHSQGFCKVTILDTPIWNFNLFLIDTFHLLPSKIPQDSGGLL